MIRQRVESRTDTKSVRRSTPTSLGKTLTELVDRAVKPRLLVIGDIMLDQYVSGSVDRVSPEAPVLILRAQKREERLGGSASVAGLLRGLGASVDLAGVLGDDNAGKVLTSLLRGNHINDVAVFVDRARCTTTKERLLGRTNGRLPHHLLRIDSESQERLSSNLQQQFLDFLKSRMPAYDAILVADYGKGACTPAILKTLIDQTRTLGKPLIVDPAPGKNCQLYAGAKILKPNRNELAWAVGHEIDSIDNAAHGATYLRESLAVKAVVATLDADGMVIVSDSGVDRVRAPNRTTVRDITGAGDTVLAVLGYCQACGMDIASAARVASVAAGLQIQSVGVIPIWWKEIIRGLNRAFLGRQKCDDSLDRELGQDIEKRGATVS